MSQKAGRSFDKIFHSLDKSIKLLEESGSQIELSKSKVELARHYLKLGQKQKAKELTVTSSSALPSMNESLIPEDLRMAVGEKPVGENLLKEVLNLAQEVVNIRNHKDLVQHIISAVNRITGAERGAIFLLEGLSPHTSHLAFQRPAPPA